MGKYLSSPKNGWSSLDIGEFHGPLSYIDDVAYMLLDTFKTYYENRTASVVFDCEGWEFVLAITEYRIYIIEEKNESKLYSFDLDADEFIRDVMDDLENDYEKWCVFSTADEPEALISYRWRLDLMMKELKEKLSGKKKISIH